MNDIKLILSLAAVLIAGASAFYSKLQVDIAENSYYAAKEQLSLARKELHVSEESYKTAKEQLELQKQMISLDSQFPVVIDTETNENMMRPMFNGRIVNITYHNNSKRPYVYRVLVKSEGIGIYWPNYIPDKLEFGIYLDRLQIVVPADGTYSGNFVVWLAQTPSKEAKLQIYINDVLSANYHYLYDKKQNAYIYQGV